nr:MAG TPA: DNA N-6-adenine-methyltransferase [Caudoviricetes sp.]
MRKAAKLFSALKKWTGVHHKRFSISSTPNSASRLMLLHFRPMQSAHDSGARKKMVFGKIGGGEKVFCNPPYGRDCWRWIKKACIESEKSGTVVVMLIAARTSNSEWHDYIFSHAKEVRFIRGRLKFETKNGTASSAPFPSAVVVFQAHDGKCELCTM